LSRRGSAAGILLTTVVAAAFVLLPRPAHSDTVGRLQPFDEEKWEDARAETVANAFSTEFRDSLVSALGTKPFRGMRRVRTRPFQSGETLVYSVGWGPVRAGYGILTLTPGPTPGRLAVTVEGITNPFFSAIYRVRDLLYCEMDSLGIYPFFFEEHLREGRYRDNRWVVFDPETGKACTHRGEHVWVDAPRFSESIASLLYYLRTLDLPVRDSIAVDCFVQKKNYQVTFVGRKKEKVKTDFGEFTCAVVDPVLVGKGRVFTHRDRIRIWFTDDENRLPIMVRSKIAVGSITAQLIGYQTR